MPHLPSQVGIGRAFCAASGYLEADTHVDGIYAKGEAMQLHSEVDRTSSDQSVLELRKVFSTFVKGKA